MFVRSATLKRAEREITRLSSFLSDIQEQHAAREKEYLTYIKELLDRLMAIQTPYALRELKPPRPSLPKPSQRPRNPFPGGIPDLRPPDPELNAPEGVGEVNSSSTLGQSN